MGCSLISTSPAFRRSLETSAAFLRPLGIDLMGCFQTDAGWTVPTQASVGLLALQIALVDMMREEYDLQADGFLGHSAGELALGHVPHCRTRGLVGRVKLSCFHPSEFPSLRVLPMILNLSKLPWS